MFGLWYLKEVPWKIGNIKKNPCINQNYGYGMDENNKKSGRAAARPDFGT